MASCAKMSANWQTVSKAIMSIMFSMTYHYVEVKHTMHYTDDSCRKSVDVVKVVNDSYDVLTSVRKVKAIMKLADYLEVFDCDIVLHECIRCAYYDPSHRSPCLHYYRREAHWVIGAEAMATLYHTVV